MNLKKLQEEHKKWIEYNFPNATSDMQFKGVVEEVGELSHALLKREQGIRGSKEQHERDIKDAIGDIIIFLSGLCIKENLSLEECVFDTWAEVKKRDWIENPETGKSTGDCRECNNTIRNYILLLRRGLIHHHGYIECPVCDKKLFVGDI